MNDFIDTHRYRYMKYVGQNFFWLPVCSGIPVICYQKFWSFNLSSFFHLELCDIDLQFLSQTDGILNPDSMRQTRLLVIVFRSMQVSEVERERVEREKKSFRKYASISSL